MIVRPQALFLNFYYKGKGGGGAIAKAPEMRAGYFGGSAPPSSSWAIWSRKVPVIPRMWLPGQ